MFVRKLLEFKCFSLQLFLTQHTADVWIRMEYGYNVNYEKKSEISTSRLVGREQVREACSVHRGRLIVHSMSCSSLGSRLWSTVTQYRATVYQVN